MPAIDHGRQPFAEQVRVLRGRLENLVPTERWTDIQKNQHDRAFVVAGAMKADLLGDLGGAVQAAIEDGESLDQFRQRFDEIVAKHGWDYRGPRDWRTRTIYRTNMSTTYAAGRVAQQRDPELAQVLPYWQYRHGGSADPRPQHLGWDGLTLPADHEWFKTHYPPNGWGCTCRVVSVSARQVERQGGTVSETPPDDGTDPKTGMPAGIDRGWDYMPGDSLTQELRTVANAKAAAAPAPLGDEFAAATSPVITGSRRQIFQGQSFTGQRPGLYDLDRVPITRLSGREFGAVKGKKALGKAADDLLRRLREIEDGVYNHDTGWGLRLNRDAIKKMGDNADQTPDESRAVAGLIDIARRAVVGDRHQDRKGDPQVVAISRLYAAVEIAEVLYRVRLTVKERVEGHRLLHALEIEGALPGIFPRDGAEAPATTGQPTTGRSISIEELLRGAIRYSDGQPFSPEAG